LSSKYSWYEDTFGPGPFGKLRPAPAYGTRAFYGNCKPMFSFLPTGGSIDDTIHPHVSFVGRVIDNYDGSNSEQKLYLSVRSIPAYPRFGSDEVSVSGAWQEY
jgi:hypothetical protein